MSDIRTVLVCLTLLLSTIGANFSSIVQWGDKIYNINEYFDTFVRKDEVSKIAIDMLLIIEPQIRDDISSIEITINQLIKSDADDQLIYNMRNQLKKKVIELETIRTQIKRIIPEWTPDEKDNNH